MYRETIFHTNMQQKHHKIKSSCVCLHVGGLCGTLEKYNFSRVLLLQLCRYPEHICHFCVVLYRTIISQFKIFISCFTVYKKTDFWLALFQYFLFCFETKSRVFTESVVELPCLCQCLNMNITYLFTCHFLMPVRVCDTGTGVLMWWRVLSAVWWKMEWRHTSNRTINAVPGASVLE